jgi:hypothetical protein
MAAAPSVSPTSVTVVMWSLIWEKTMAPSDAPLTSTTTRAAPRNLKMVGQGLGFFSCPWRAIPTAADLFDRGRSSLIADPFG